MDLTIANEGGVQRDYRKGNWNLQETMVLIEAKKMDDERRMKRVGDSTERGKPAELRWKWVEDYCWRKGCFRSQNQCNDKWDNLMRDFKKVREFERRAADKSYWRMDKIERKDNNLPSNMLPLIYEALVAVVDRKPQTTTPPPPPNVPTTLINVEKSTAPSLGVQSPLHPPAILPPPPTSARPFPTEDSDTSEYSGSAAKRRKRRDGGEGGEVGSAISKGASIIAEAIQSCEDREDERHKQMVNLHERKLQIEETKAEINRQGINGLVDAINKLANSMLALAAHTTKPSSK
ncbi:trihelix transcription factor ASR3-like [Salvia miltiorrhiza]|uniref:trihelix transcription factor ASR3-like n=1 Tax=Salvia miltiorrhiza TaxID=226208 RepID=UPI0025ABD7E7|nr:trihelix transcription factor ASR3-like [Salvia miltiorrhiza]